MAIKQAAKKGARLRNIAQRSSRPVTFSDLIELRRAAAPDAAPAATRVSQRKNQAKLTQQEQGEFLDAIVQLNQRGVLAQLVSIHSDMSHTMHNMNPNDPTDPEAALGQQRFLPWHRVLLYEVEREIQVINRNVAIPYWDWSDPQQQQIPAWLRSFSLTVTIDIPNEDASVTQLTVTVSRAPSTPQQLANYVADLAQATVATDYTTFARDLERIHDNVHVWVGGTMGIIQTAAADPLFWMHHANVDRIWSEWQQGPGKELYPQLQGLDVIMDPWRYDEPSTRDLATFNYQYVP